MAREIEIEWPELGSKVVATLLEDKNPSLCKVLWSNLPIESVQSYSVASGDRMYLCHNIVAFVEPEYTETYDEPKYWGNMPMERLKGTVVFSTMGSIWGLGIWWGGKFVEPSPVSPVAQVRKEDLETLQKVGEQVRHEFVCHSKYYSVIVRRRA